MTTLVQMKPKLFNNTRQCHQGNNGVTGASDMNMMLCLDVVIVISLVLPDKHVENTYGCRTNSRFSLQ
jgi:hypothetical protein